MENKTQEKNKKFDARLMSFTAVAAIIGAGLATGMGVSAYGGMMEFRGGDSEDGDALRTALENDDYETWSSLMDDSCTQEITEERFDEMVERHAENSKNRDAIEEAIEANNFKTWSTLSSEFDRGRAFEVITEENFSKFVEMHNAMEAGNYEEANELRKELGLNVRPQDGSGKQNGRGMRGGMGR
jgi:hypothetical protein